MYQPLADALRPQELSDVCGQQHILGENGLLRRIIESGSVPNMIFYGPSGTGKTTVANLIAKKTQRKLCKLNATTASSADIKEIYAQLDTFLAPNGVLLYLDEIQYFNKKQQQTLLEYIENGKITLIASTTENPYFYVYNAILSRSTVFEFKPVEKDEAQRAVSRALNYLEARDSVTILPEPGVKEHIAQSCGGDIRKALNAVEFLYTATRPENGVVRLTMADAKQVSQRSAMRYDKSGDDHYDDLSALMKSIRGSDPDAAVHYLARFLEAGDLPSACRRILCSVAEDIGLAYPQAIPIVKACVDSALQLGLPDMAVPIQYALTWPERTIGPARPLDLLHCPPLTFGMPDCEAFPCLAIAMEAARTGGTATAILNGANEAAVGLFLEERIGFMDIPALVERAMSVVPVVQAPQLEQIMAADRAARDAVRSTAK